MRLSNLQVTGALLQQPRLRLGRVRAPVTNVQAVNPVKPRSVHDRVTLVYTLQGELCIVQQCVWHGYRGVSRET
jgi:hypothetical protein